MVKILLAVDGSPSAVRATRKLAETIGWYREPPGVELLAVHLPVPRFSNMGVVVSEEMIEHYYAEECERMLAPCREVLAAAGIACTERWLVGPVAETIVERAHQSAASMIYMGTRGLTALSNMVLGSVTSRVLHLADIPVVLVR
jgi:nucleotide-binding universal stress UspA family protein